jgi:hypothetical protein
VYLLAFHAYFYCRVVLICRSALNLNIRCDRLNTRQYTQHNTRQHTQHETAHATRDSTRNTRQYTQHETVQTTRDSADNTRQYTHETVHTRDSTHTRQYTRLSSPNIITVTKINITTVATCNKHDILTITCRVRSEAILPRYH